LDWPLFAARNRRVELEYIAFGLTALLLGCTVPEVCETQVTRGDGGVFTCVRPEDCPRASNVVVCVTGGTAEQDCVNCVETRCVRTSPGACR
jgi:hypothetical protein